MVEQGLSMYIQTGLAALEPPVVAAGAFFGAQLPKDQISASSPMAFAYRSIIEDPNYNLSGPGLREWQVQIDCHGFAQANSITLANAIKKILDPGFQGEFSDPDETLVAAIFRLHSQIDGFSDSNRSYVRSLEYAVMYRPS